MTDFNVGAFNKAMDSNKSKMDNKAVDAGYVGGLHLGPIGIPNHFMGFGSHAQEKAQMAASQYQQQMQNILQDYLDAIKATADPAASS